MAESAVSEPVELGRDSRRRFIPLHPAVDTGIGSTGVLDVAFGSQFLRPVSPGTARYRSLHAEEINLRQPAGLVKRIGLGRLAWADRLKVTDRLSNRRMCARRVDRGS